MKKLNLKLDDVKEQLKSEQIRRITAGYDPPKCNGVDMPTEPGSEEEGEWVCIDDKWKWIEDIG